MFSLTFLLTAAIAGTSASNISNLMVAIEDGNIDRVSELLGTVDVNSKDEFGLNVLHAACYSNGEITRLLISHGASRVVNDNFYALGSVVSPLFLACYTIDQYGYPQPHIYEIIEAMLKAGGDPNVSDSTLRTPLHYIATGPEARLLISYGADVNAKDMHGYTPAFTCFSIDYLRINHEVLYALADGNADFAIANDFGNTIFHMNSDFDALTWTKELVTFLARNGVPLDAVNDEGETALTKYLKCDVRADFWMYVNQSTLYESLKDSFYAYMTEAGANLSAPNERGETLLHLAVLKYCAGMAKWLLENGAYVEAKNANGDPPLLALVKQEKSNYEISNSFLPSKGKTAIVRALIDVLVDGGADAYFKDGDGHDAAYYLRKSRMTWVDWNIESSLKTDVKNMKNWYIFFGT